MRARWSSADWRQAARRALPRFVFDYIEGGAEDEQALRRNRAAFEDWALIPRVLRDVAQRDTSIDLYGERAALPLMIAPMGLNGIVRPQGDQMLARAAAAMGVPLILSNAANAAIEDIVEACGRAPWFQLYVVNRRNIDVLVDRAHAAGCPVLVLTVDTAVSGKRTRDLRNGLTPPMRPRARTFLDIVRRPRWALRHAGHRRALYMPNIVAADESTGDRTRLLGRVFDPSFDWDALARLRDRWRRPLVVKGLLCAEDAERAIALGVDGIVVSNHGGRQLDGAPAALHVLPEIVRAAGQRAAVFMDGGIRRGEDVLKAIALGADAVLLGRAVLYGLAADGEAGVRAVLAQFHDDVSRGLALLGCTGIDQVGRDRIRPAAATQLREPRDV